jgi:hypothetical protein
MATKTKDDMREEMRAIAKDMGISVKKLALGISIEREMKLANKESRRNSRNESTKATRTKMVDRVAEKFPVHSNENSRTNDYSREWSQLHRDAIANDPAVIAARKVFRAIPRESSAIVITRPGYEVVKIAKAERALNPVTISRQLAKAETRAEKALAKADNATAVMHKRTNLERVPIAERANVARLNKLADKEIARIALLRKRLAKANAQKQEMGMTIVPVKDIRVSLRPQSMANAVAKALLEIPDRKDVHPFRELPKIRNARQFGPHSYESQPEREYREYVEMVEREQKREAILEADRARREQWFREMAELAEREAMAQIEAQREARREADKLRKRNARANSTEATRAIEAMRKRESRRNAKIRNAR